MTRYLIPMAFWCVANLAMAADSTPMYTTQKSLKDYYKVQITLPKFGNSKLQKVATNEYKKEANKWLNEFMKAVEEAKANGTPIAPYELRIATMVSINRPRVVSAYLTIFMSTGGAHPNTMLRSLNFGIKNGYPKQIHISDILAPNVSKPMMLDKIILPALNKVKQARGAEIATEVDPALMNSFVVTPAGIAWLFEPYTAGPYVEGYFVAKVLNAELKEWVRPDHPLKL